MLASADRCYTLAFHPTFVVQGEGPSTAPKGGKACTFLGRPAVEVVLAPYIPSNKRARSEDAGDATGAAGGGGGSSGGSSRGAAPLGTLHNVRKGGGRLPARSAVRLLACNMVLPFDSNAPDAACDGLIVFMRSHAADVTSALRLLAIVFRLSCCAPATIPRP